jgi:hypothetical protein
MYADIRKYIRVNICRHSFTMEHFLNSFMPEAFIYKEDNYLHIELMYADKKIYTLRVSACMHLLCRKYLSIKVIIMLVGIFIRKYFLITFNGCKY